MDQLLGKSMIANITNAVPTFSFLTRLRASPCFFLFSRNLAREYLYRYQPILSVFSSWVSLRKVAFLISCPDLTSWMMKGLILLCSNFILSGDCRQVGHCLSTWVHEEHLMTYSKTRKVYPMTTIAGSLERVDKLKQSVDKPSIPMPPMITLRRWWSSAPS